jgi:hypothetical protein
LYFVTDVSGQPVCPLFRGQAVQKECHSGVDEDYSCGTLCHLDRYVFADVSEDFIAFIFRIMQSKKIFDPENGRQKTVSS